MWLPAPATAARTKIEISDDRWEAIKKVARRDGLPPQVVLEQILDFGLEASKIDTDTEAVAALEPFKHAPRC